MRVLYVVPYSPFRLHDHAATDMVPPLVKLLARRTDLHVYTPGPAGVDDQNMADLIGCSIVEAPSLKPRSHRARFGVRPYWQNAEWPASQRMGVREAVAKLRPDVVHGDYLQVGDSICDYPSTVLGYHDNTTEVVRRMWETSRAPTSAYRYAEYLRTRRLEARVTKRIGVPVAISAPVLDELKKWNPRSVMIRPGIEIPTQYWKPVSRPAPRVLFSGAMWREANLEAATTLVRDVMPLVWRDRPDAVLRIVGARPGPSILALAGERVEVTGHVDSLDLEMLASDVCLATTRIGGGLLFKAIRPMALGCPVVMNRSVAAGVGADTDVAQLADTSSEIAEATLRLLGDVHLAIKSGENARVLVQNEFRWERAVECYLDAYQQAADAR